MMALKQHVKARYRLSDLIRAQKNDKMTSNLSTWVWTGVKEKGDLEEDSYWILSQFYKERRDLLYHTAEGVVVCRRKDEEKILHRHNLICTKAIPDGSVVQIARPEGTSGNRQGTTKNFTQVWLARVEKGCERWVNACLSCLQVKDPRKMKFRLKSVESSGFNEVVQIDHQKICMADFTKLSGTGNHRPLYETGRSGTMSDGLSGRDL